MKTAKYTKVPSEHLFHSPNNPRRRPTADDPAVQELSDSIREVGILEPILACKCGPWKHEIIAGARRFEAAKLAGLADIPCMVYADLDTETMLDMTVTENLQRQDLTPLEEGRGVASLLEGRDVETVAGILGKSPSFVRRRAKLKNLIKDWVDHLEQPLGEFGDKQDEIKTVREAITAGHLEIIAQFPDKVQKSILKRIMSNPRDLGRNISEFRWTIRNFLMALDGAPWPLESDWFGLPCSTCPTRSDAEPDLFKEIVKSGETPHCLNLECFKEKYQRFIDHKVNEAVSKTKKDAIKLSIGYGGNGPKADYNLYQVKTAKKTDKDAVPAVMVDGEKAGEMMWVIPPKETAQGNEKKSREATLEQKRIKHIGDALIAWIKELKDLPGNLDSSAFRMLAALLCFPLEGFTNEFTNEFTAQDFMHMTDGSQGGGDKLFQEAWNAIKECMVNDLTNTDPRYVNVKNGTRLVHLACEVLGLEMFDFETEAEKAFPDEEKTKKATTKKGAKKS